MPSSSLQKHGVIVRAMPVALGSTRGSAIFCRPAMLNASPARCAAILASIKEPAKTCEAAGPAAGLGE
jgi:hypothetical protein